jgi:DNA-binding response OmpR family regulator
MSTTAPINVLYLDHDDDSREMLFTLLAFDQIRVVSVIDVEAAAATARTSHPDLFLLADRFDDLGVTDLCRRLRSDFPYKPIIFYSANARRVDIERGLAAGADAYLLKPDTDDIVSTIKSQMRRYTGDPAHTFGHSRSIAIPYRAAVPEVSNETAFAQIR